VPFGDALDPIVDDAPGTHDSVPVTQRQRFLALAVDRRDGKLLWQTTLREELPHEGGHVTGSYASASPTTDGEVLIAPFGSRGLHALDLAGKVLWTQDLGRMATKHAHGEGSSPLLVGDSVVVVWEPRGRLLVAAFDKRTGKERWRVARDEETSWASPIAVEHGERTQVVVSGTNRIRGYDLENGAVLWQCGGLSSNVVCSPVSAGGLVFAGKQLRESGAARHRPLAARGEITGGEAVLWTRRRATPYVPSLLLVEDTLYFLHHYQGFLARVSARTGAEPERAFRLAGVRRRVRLAGLRRGSHLRHRPQRPDRGACATSRPAAVMLEVLARNNARRQLQRVRGARRARAVPAREQFLYWLGRALTARRGALLSSLAWQVLRSLCDLQERGSPHRSTTDSRRARRARSKQHDMIPGRSAVSVRARFAPTPGFETDAIAALPADVRRQRRHGGTGGQPLRRMARPAGVPAHRIRDERHHRARAMPARRLPVRADGVRRRRRPRELPDERVPVLFPSPPIPP
jgi:hypothetical protein